jgi:hypothetical protein
MSIEDVAAKYLKTGIVDKKTVAAHRHTMNQRKMLLYFNISGAPKPKLFNLSDQGRSLPPPIQDDGSDVEDRLSPRPDSPPLTLDVFLSKLFQQFIIDITGKSPNPRGITNPSYMKLTIKECQAYNEELYKNPMLSDIFCGVAYKHAPTIEWHRAFKWLFPPAGFKATNEIQNYPSCLYFKAWMDFIENPQNNLDVTKDTREAIWIPDAQQDKIWPTTTLSGFNRWPPTVNASGRSQAAPRILLKEDVTPLFETEDGDDSEGSEIARE